MCALPFDNIVLIKKKRQRKKKTGQKNRFDVFWRGYRVSSTNQQQRTGRGENSQVRTKTRLLDQKVWVEGVVGVWSLPLDLCLWGFDLLTLSPPSPCFCSASFPPPPSAVEKVRLAFISVEQVIPKGWPFFFWAQSKLVEFPRNSQEKPGFVTLTASSFYNFSQWYFLLTQGCRALGREQHAQQQPGHLLLADVATSRIHVVREDDARL